MRWFGFSLEANTELREDPGGGGLFSRTPLRILRVNRPLYRLLEYIRGGGEIEAYQSHNGQTEKWRWLPVLLSLASRGYLRLERIAEIEDYPPVSVVIPVRDRAADLRDCLRALEQLDYPSDRLEIIVVDDGSKREIPADIKAECVRVIRQAEPRGPAAGRNLGAASASGEILAFLDADCMARTEWLRELVPFFGAPTVGAVGGFVDGYYRGGFLDRYEAVFSSLNMGRRVLIGGDSAATLYVPTANMLVRREVFQETGGFREGLRVGEDVDFCWRMRGRGHTLLYVPHGKVAHRHRHQLGQMLKRRAQYGTSEAGLYATHRDKRKRFIVSVPAGISFLALAAAVLAMNPYPLCAVPLALGLDMWRKAAALEKYNTGVPLRGLAAAALRSQASFSYFALFHLVRYYLLPLLALGFALHSLWLFSGLAALYTSIVDYYVKRPKLNFPAFLFFYIAEHAAYQLGAFWGCLKLGSFRAYLPSLRAAPQNEK